MTGVPEITVDQITVITVNGEEAVRLRPDGRVEVFGWPLSRKQFILTIMAGLEIYTELGAVSEIEGGIVARQLYLELLQARPAPLKNITALEETDPDMPF